MSEAVLLDANVLIALAENGHEHHEAARAWFVEHAGFATSPSTQRSLVCFLVRVASVEHALGALELLTDHPRHEFWPDALPYDADVLSGITGHRQVTDAYLARAAASRGSLVATFDAGLAALRPDVVTLVPT